ncbi:MAG: cysteine desulfurase NifS [Ruminococcaceae bacterium]|nr:cysteine desulfurase NifS [Oscillospiraceae bacterium]
MNRFVYLDNSATTPVKPEVLEVMLPYLKDEYGNPSSIYKKAAASSAAVSKAREQVAAALGAESNEIFFTACGTEADNWAIKGAAFANQQKGKHIISSQIEHHAVLHSLEYLEKQGFSVTYLPVDKEGRVNPEDLKNAITDETILVTIMMANNEVGTIEPIAELAKIAHEKKVLFHTDAVQAVGSVPVDVKALDVDMLSLSAHKFGGPKGVGALYIKKGTKIDTFMHGGAQERNRRAGTENVAGIAGLGEAITLATKNLPDKIKRLETLRNKLIDGVLKTIPDSHVNGSLTDRLPGNANFCFRYIEGEALLLRLDAKGVAASSGSACTSGSLDPSHVLLALGLPHEVAHGSLRLSIGEQNTEEDIDYVLEILPGIVQILRMMSPLFPGN